MLKSSQITPVRGPLLRVMRWSLFWCKGSNYFDKGKPDESLIWSQVTNNL